MSRSISYPIEDVRLELLGLDPLEVRTQHSNKTPRTVVMVMDGLGIPRTNYHRWCRTGRISRESVELIAKRLGIHPANLVSSYWVPSAHFYESSWMTFTTKHDRMRKPGWYIECQEGKLGPHKSLEAAEKRLAAITSLGACRYEHTIVAFEVEKLA